MNGWIEKIYKLSQHYPAQTFVIFLAAAIIPLFWGPLRWFTSQSDQFDKEHRLKAVSLLVVDNRLTKTKVFRVRYIAGDVQSRTPQTPIKNVTVYLPEAVQRNALNPKDTARYFSDQVIGPKISKDPQFKDLHHFEIEIAEVDLSEYPKLNLEASSGVKARRELA